MRLNRAFLSGVLVSSMLLSLAAPAAAANPRDGASDARASAVGSITTTLRLDYTQKLSELTERDVTLSLKRGGTTLTSVKLGSGAVDSSLNPSDITYTARNGDGGDLGGGQWPDYLDVTVSNLPQGTYTLELQGDGYVSHSQPVSLSDYAQTVILGTGDRTFQLGDVNHDNQVTEADKTLVAEALGTTDPAMLASYDLNGDDLVDIVDLAYVSRQLHARGEAQILNTTLLAPKVDTAEIQNISSGRAQDLFLDNGSSVTFQPQDGTLDIPFTLTDTPELSAIEVVTPDGLGAIQKGTLLVMDDQNQISEYPFDNTMPDGIHPLSLRANSNVISIDLGRRIPVKKVTVSVTQYEGSYVVVDSIQFLQDIVPETPVTPNKVQNVRAEAGDETVTLSWSEMPNVSGYKVVYWPKNGMEQQQAHVDVPTATISGLKNLETYCFTVTPTSQGWEGKPSQVVEAQPQPASVPSAPDMVNIKAGDGALQVSWKKSKTATSYEVYYTDVANAAPYQYQKAGDSLSDTHTTIPNLTNGTPYYVYVVAVNGMGKSGPSKIATGTPVAVEYKEPAGLPKDMTRIPRDQVASIALKDPNNYSSSGTMPFTTDYLMDGDYRTNWTSQSYGDGTFARSKQIIYTFQNPVDLNSVVYIPRADGFDDSMRLYGITVWCEGDDLNGSGTTLVAMDGKGQTPIHGKMGNAQDGYFIVLPFPATKNIMKIAVDLEQTGYGAVGVSEVIFFQYDENKALDAKIDAIFADAAHTQLVQGVSIDQINALSTALTGNEGYYFDPDTMRDELKLAAELVNGPSSGVVLQGLHSRSSAADSQSCGQGGSDFQPLGVSAEGGKPVTIYAQGIPAGESVTLWATQYYAEASTWQANLGTLQNGRNVVTIPQIGTQNTPRGGSLYVTYTGSHGDGITLHTRRATDIPVLELSNWNTMDEPARRAVIADYVKELSVFTQSIPASDRTSNPKNATELSMPSVLLSIPATTVMDNTGKGGEAEQCETLYRNVEAWEQVMEIARTTQGIETAMTSRQNIRYMQMFAGAFMYAAGSHIGVEYGSCGGLVNGRPMDAATGMGNLFGWGIAHEIGHNMDKLGKAECTNNIYALMIQTFDGQNNVGTSRLESSGKYAEIFQKTALGHPGASNDVFVQLGLYWQLHLAYDGKLNEQQGPMDFYNRFFKEWKAGTHFTEGDSYDDKVALTASYVTQTNLTDFFTRWGMQLSEQTRQTLAQYGRESRAIWYLDDNSRRDRLNGVDAGVGTVSARARLQGESTVVLTMDAPLTAGKLQGYEIRRNGTPVGFTSENTFTDTIGSANNMNFTYTVQAYDTLGNPIGSAVSAGDIRVSYDKVLPADAYTLSRDGTTVTVTMTAGTTPISGIKLVDSGDLSSQGTYTVTVTAHDKTVVAKDGDYRNNESTDPSNYIAYFNKPNTDSSDSRIWTYDVDTLVMTNVPENAELQLIRYAGDNVGFTQGGAVGRLERDYVYGPNPGDQIAAGTLVITGTYRGDPVYNTLRIKGDFSTTVVGEDGTQEIQRVERYLDGYALLFAEVPQDGEVSTISDGFFIFVPNVQKEQELQGEQSHCTMDNLLPTRMMVELYRTDDPSDTSSMRLTSSSSWIYSPGGEELPTIELKGDHS